MEKANNDYSLLGRFISLMFLVFLSIIIVFFWKNQETQKEISNKHLQEITYNLNHLISNDLHIMEKKLRFLTTQISTASPSMNEIQIKTLLRLFSKTPKMHVIQEDPIEWIGYEPKNSKLFAAEEHKTILYTKVHEKSNMRAARKLPAEIKYQKKSINYFNYLKTSIGTNLNLHLATQIDTKLIPVDMRAEKMSEKYLGYLTTGISFKELDRQMATISNLQGKEIYYAVFNIDDYRIITHSPNFDLLKKEAIVKQMDNINNGGKNYISYKSKDENYLITKIIESPILFVVGSSILATNNKGYSDIILSHKFELLFLMVIICSFTYLFYHFILSPFLLLSQAALSLLEGNTDTIIPKTYSKEGALVAGALEKINKLLIAEKNLAQEMAQTRNTLSLANLRLENKVAERTKELEEALVTKTSFLNNLNHEIKAPLQSIDNILRDLVSHWQDIEDQKKLKLSEQVSHASHRVLSLVGNLLEIAKFSDGKAILDFKSIDMVYLVKDVIAECKMLYIHNKKVTISFSNNQVIYASVDRNRIKQVLRNLLLNAIKYSSLNGFISVNVSQTKTTQGGFKGDAVLVSVYDQGIGIPEDELSGIFSPFSSKNKATGAGLGLTICREIIGAHHGKIWADNNKDGGATFNFIVPVVQPVEVTNYSPLSTNLSNHEYNVVMIDDEEVCLNSMEMLLYGTKYNLVKINSAEFALEYLEQNARYISLIFVDLMMPDVYGINLVTAIKENADLAEIPIILQTSSSDEKEISKAFEEGVFSLITKPYQKKRLLDEINSAMQFRKLNNLKGVVINNPTSVHLHAKAS